METHAPLFEILLVEDNPGDVRLTEEAFREGRIAHRLSVVSDGEEALSFVRKKGKYADAPRPDLILLDLSLPKRDGREVLQDLKNDPELRNIPVVILTTSDGEQDIRRAYKFYANSYMIKPVQVDEFLRKIRCLEIFWLKVVRLPHEAY
jgi:CheY-like chemotaxis protein